MHEATRGNLTRVKEGGGGGRVYPCTPPLPSSISPGACGPGGRSVPSWIEEPQRRVLRQRYCGMGERGDSNSQGARARVLQVKQRRGRSKGRREV